MESVIATLLLPLLGTMPGAAGVFFVKDRMPQGVQKGMLGFASGVMIAASVWSLIVPAMDFAAPHSALGKVLPAAVGVLLGMLFLLAMDYVTPHIHIDNRQEGLKRFHLSRTSKLVLAITIHKIPEGMAVGVTLAAALADSAVVSMAGAVALALGIAVQNIPEGAIVSMPLLAAGNSAKKAFWIGTMTGGVEIAAILATMWIVSAILSVLPYLLAFAAGAMLYVVVEEIIPETSRGEHSNIGTIGFAIGFVVMMVLDTVLA